MPCDVELLLNDEGRPSGHALVIFDSPTTVREAMKKNREYMGERYITLSLEPSMLTDAISPSYQLFFACSDWAEATAFR